jgi:hypothetical protein
MFILLVNWPPAPLPGKHMKQKNTIPQHSSTQHNREHHHVRQYHPPMPPTKAMGAITQNAAATLPQHHDQRRGTRVWSDLDGRGSGGTIYWGAYSRQNSAGGGGLIPWPNCDGRTELDRLSRSKESTIQPYHNKPSGASVDCSKGSIAMSLVQKVVLSFNGYGEKGQSNLWLNPRMLPSLGSVGIQLGTCK